ncbi:ATP-binding protein [Candidatus Electronema sp. PJ]|uniref:ATP-binding protein n=1 Tax=Candidatus Electronema sp. PJ TaxID=3401572 RepID=UPI003AA8F03F
MLGIKQKLIFGFGSLLAVMVVIGLLTMSQIEQLGQAIDLILTENYRSVLACQTMKEALAGIDNGILSSLLGQEAEGQQLIDEHVAQFHQALAVELSNITLPQEQEKAEQIQVLFMQYLQAVPQATGSVHDKSNVQLLSGQIKQLAQEILIMNQNNMIEASTAARRLATIAHRHMLTAIAVAALLALLFSYLTQQWILHPIKRLIELTNEIRQGNLDLVLETCAHDEVGLLSESFNEMTAALRQVRNTNKTSLLRTRQATEEVFKALPDAVAVLDLEGRVELATETAERHFGLKPGVLAHELGYAWLPPLLSKALTEGRTVEHDLASGCIQQFVDQREYFFQPMAIPIPLGSEHLEPNGLALILKDVTQIHEQEEMKRGVVATVSHQLKTPLTSLRMAIHLLLEDKIGPLNTQQNELLIAAREESERLANILDDLLNLNRIEAGKAELAPAPVLPLTLAQDAVEPFLAAAKDKGLTLTNQVPEELPLVLADAEKIRQVFTNLLTNALRFTAPGGAITVQAERKPNLVHFLVADTGTGIAHEHLNRLFEQFYRAPGQDEKSGIGLGLSIVREIIQAHNGQVSVESRLGQGSIFGFTLPLAGNCEPQ